MKKMNVILQNPKFIGFLILLLGFSFFGFVDDRFRGWDDTNQYQLEAQAWNKGARPPVREMLMDPSSHMGPTHVPPLTPYAWSFLLNKSDYHLGLWRIKILQAFLLAFCFFGLVFLISRPRLSYGAVVIGILLFFNEFFRQLVSIPISEPLSIALLIASYLWPRFAGVGVVLEALVRPPVTLLFLPLLWKHKKSKEILFGGLITALIAVLFFRSLVIPSRFSGSGFGWINTISIWKSLVIDSSYNLFDHLFPYTKPWFQALWSFILAIGIAMFLFFKKKDWRMIFAGLYFMVILIPFGQGIRYFIPLLIFIILEFKPTLSKSKWITAFVVIMALHLTARQIDAIPEFKRYSVPETESSGIVKVKTWLKDNHFEKERLLMGRFRYCVNYFQTVCYGLAVDFSDPIADIKSKGIRFIIFPNIDWQVEETAFKRKVKNIIEKQNQNFNSLLLNFDGVEVLDVSRISNGKISR